MRQNPNSRRSRGRGGRKPGNSRNQVYDSNGPGARVRGNSSQIYEKYQQLARDAASSGDRIAAENFYQHAEHYYRLLEASGANRNPGTADDSQQRSEGGNPSGNGASNGKVAQNDDKAERDEAVVIAEAAAQPAPEANSEHPPESVAALIEAVEQANTGQDEQAAPAAANGGGQSEDDAKPARRTRSRRSNGSANVRPTTAKASKAAAADEDAEPAGEDTNPANA